MARNLIVTTDTGDHLLTEVSVGESVLQSELNSHPHLLPVEDFELGGPLLVVAREASFPSGKADLLGVVPSGDIVIVEFKTGPQNPDFRQAIAQALDYGSHLWSMTLEQFESIATTYFSSKHCPPGASLHGCPNLREAAKQTWDLDDAGFDEFAGDLSDCLAMGSFTYVIAAQRFTDAMRTTAEYLNSAQPACRFYLVEVVQLRGDGIIATEAHVDYRPTSTFKRTRSASSTLSEEQFLDNIVDESYRHALAALFDHCRQLGFRLEWKTSGAAIRIDTGFRPEPFSIGWVAPDSGNTRRRDVTLGYFTGPRQRLGDLPEAARILQWYSTAIQDRFPSAEPLQRKNFTGFHLEPHQVVEDIEKIKDLLTEVLARFNGEP